MPGSPIRNDTASREGRPAAHVTHPMDPRRGENLSPMFAAFLCWLLQLPPMAEPKITGISISGRCVFAATTQDPYHNYPYRRLARPGSKPARLGHGVRRGIRK